MKSSPASRAKGSWPSSPWFYFFLFVFWNAFLSYAPLPEQVRNFGLVGAGVLAFFYWKTVRVKKSSAEDREFLPALPAWAALALLALALRLYRLTTLSAWPLYDEGMYGYYALGLSKHWSWQMFYGSSEAPPLYLWMEAGLFRLFGASLLTLWLLPALISFLLFPAAYWAARGFFSRSLSLICALVAGFSFWPLYVGRFSLMTGLVLLCECLVLGILGRLAKAPPTETKKTAVFLGFALGLGFYTYLHWPALAALVLATLGFFAWKRGKDKGSFPWLWFLVPLFLSVLPLAWGLGSGGGQQLLFYLHHLSAAQSPSLLGQLGISLSYISSLFWGMDLKYHTYQPVWGGYLNPVLGALFFLGLLESLRRRREGLALWLLAGLVLFILPGALTSERATSRMVLVFPILALLAVSGLKALWGRKSLLGFLALAFLSLGLDLYHLDFAYAGLWKSQDNWKGYEKSYARSQAYLQLEAIAEKDGPGLVFTDFLPSLTDQTLDVADDRFNAAQNPSLDGGRATWAAVLANVNYQPFLKKRFPDGKAYALSKEEPEPDGGWMLWVFPVTPDRLAVVRQWRMASQSLEPFIHQSLGDISGRSYGEMGQALEQAYPAFQSDPFLESCYWDKRADMAVRRAITFKEDRARALGDSLQCLAAAVQKGWPAAHLYRELGVQEMLVGNNRQARLYLEKAMKAPLNLTDAHFYLAVAREGLDQDSKGPALTVK